jgi:uncharacterized protein YjbI with pentapeptide repeats
VLIGAALAYLQFLQQQKASHELLISNQVSKGFEQLGQSANDKVVVRLGGIYALEGVMNTSDQYYKPVLEALSAFVRDGTRTETGDGPPATDIQAALTVIERRIVIGTASPDLAAARIPKAILFEGHLNYANLNDTDLRGADLRRADLTLTDLKRANLSDARLYEANLYGANLNGANLNYANLNYANLSRASLRGTNLSRAQLVEANLSGASVYQANLSYADLKRANLSRASLGDNTNLSHADLSGADLTGADLNYANLSHTDLTDTAFLADELSKACGTEIKSNIGPILLKPC